MGAQWEVRLLSELRAVQGDREVTRFRTHKTAVLWATLACWPLKMHLREQLLAQLWPDAAPADARNNLSVALSSLRNQFEPPTETAGSVIQADRQAVGVNPTAISTDVADFERGLATADRAPNDNERIALLEAALAHYAGPLLPGFYEDWLAEERRRLAERYHGGLRALVRLLVQCQDLNRALDWVRKAVAADPLREETNRDLMRLLVATGQPSAALQQYRELETRLKQDLDAAPSGATRRMAAEIQARLQEPGAEPRSAESEATTHAAASTQPPPRHPEPTPLDGSRGRQEAADAPRGTVTFVLTQLTEAREGEAEDDETLRARVRTQHDLLGPVWERHRGYLCERTRDGWEVAFSNARDALLAAIAGQRALNAPAANAASVRMALHTGDVTPQEGRYYTRTLLRGARLLQAGYGGQILCSEATAGLLRQDHDSEVSLVDLGVYRLNGL